MSPRGVPERTCVGCRGQAPKGDLLRFVERGGVPVPDPSGSAPGRGAYVHRDPDCVELALRRGALLRALRTAGGHGELGRLRVAVEGVREQG